MLSPKEAYTIFKKAHPNLNVLECSFYDNSAYLFTAPEGDNDYTDPFYLVDANSGKLSPFVPITNMAKYTDAVRNHPIELSEMR